MDSFYESNPGLSSRVANHIDFPDYTAEELLKLQINSRRAAISYDSLRRRSTLIRIR